MDANGALRGRYSYFPYGEGRASNATAFVRDNPIRYIGRYLDSGNAVKLGARYSDAMTGRFTQMAPSGQEANPYAYVSCNPVDGTDPTGRVSECLPNAVSAILGGIGIIGELTAGAAAVAAAPATGGLSATIAFGAGISIGVSAGLELIAITSALSSCGLVK